jgi:hypothetical protein
VLPECCRSYDPSYTYCVSWGKAPANLLFYYLVSGLAETYGA